MWPNSKEKAEFTEGILNGKISFFFLQCFQCHDYQVYVFTFLSICYRIHGSLKILFYYFLNLDFSNPMMTIEEKSYLAQKL